VHEPSRRPGTAREHLSLHTAHRTQETNVISARNLSKRFGVKRVFDRVDLDLARGEFLLVTGPNGAGKTTLLRVLAGLAAPTSGELVLPERGEVGYLGHEPLVYRELTPLENLTLFGRLYRVPERGERIGMLLERFGLWDVRNERVSTFSRGMQQRLALCRVLLHDPSLLVLDEPFNALDAAGAELLDRTLTEQADRAVIVATHDPGRVEHLATRMLAFS
jgi:heme ABC exporter ATP-binding subunit CcmA